MSRYYCNRGSNRTSGIIEAGNALLELAIVIPVLIYLMFMVVDFGRCINQYLLLTRIAYEGARFGASVEGLEPGLCLGETADECTLQHRDIQRRIEDLMEANKLSPATLIATEYKRIFLSDDDEPNLADPRNNVIVIQVELPYQPILSAMLPLTMRVEATSSYLYPKETS